MKKKKKKIKEINKKIFGLKENKNRLMKKRRKT